MRVKAGWSYYGIPEVCLFQLRLGFYMKKNSLYVLCRTLQVYEASLVTDQREIVMVFNFFKDKGVGGRFDIPEVVILGDCSFRCTNCETENDRNNNIA